jgi:myo-inositol-1(or 4)-monophosphatase
LLDIAVKAARMGAKILTDNFGRIEAKDIVEKAKNDFLTFVDESSEKKIIEIISKAYPDHAILAEESGFSTQKSEYEWIIDPLDGTKNFITGIPIFSVSIALKFKNEIILGVVLDPLRNDLFHAQKDKGAFLNNKPIRVSGRSQMADCLIATGFPFKKKHLLPGYLLCFRDIFEQSSGARRMGSAAIDLAYIAAGKFDAFWEIGLSPWDMAAGSLLIAEAGGKISDFWGNYQYLENGYIIASNGLIQDQMQDIIQPHFPELIK